jgi:ADP-ribose pyrophosphatase YjhB (NUDIX family)
MVRDLKGGPRPAAEVPGATAAGPSVRTVPEGDTRQRLVCPECGFIKYENPKVVVGSVSSWEGRILLCRRAIDPRRGYWTLPAGFLELNETTIDGVRREAWEEARARIAVETLLAVYNIVHISQVQLIYRARLLAPDISAGVESQEVGLFAWDDIPWDEIAFESAHWALRHHHEVAGREAFLIGTNPPPEYSPA